MLGHTRAMGTQDLRYRRWQVIARRHPSAFLLAAQLASLVAYPLLEGHTGRVLFGAFGVVIATLAVWVVMRSPAVKWVAWLIAVPAVLLTLVAALLPIGCAWLAKSDLVYFVYSTLFAPVTALNPLLDSLKLATPHRVQQRGGDGGQCAEQSFGILPAPRRRVPLVQPVSGQRGVHPGGKMLEGRVAPRRQQRPR